MEKSIKIPLYLFGAFVLFAILHNAMYGLFGIEEPVFFFLALLSALGFAVSLIYALIVFITKLVKRDIKSSKKGLGKSERTIIKYYWTVLIMILGMVLNYLNLGVKEFAGFNRVGTYLIYVGFLGIILVTLQALWKKKKKVGIK